MEKQHTEQSSPIDKDVKLIMLLDSDTELALKAGNGDNEAMDQIITSISDKVWFELRQHCSSMSYEDRQDLSQDILFSVYRGLSKFRGDSLFKTWLAALIHRRINDWFRKSFKERNKTIFIKSNKGYADPEASFFTWDMLRYVPASYRRILKLYYKDGYKIGEIAHMDGTEYAATRSCLRRARKCIAKREYLWQ